MSSLLLGAMLVAAGWAWPRYGGGLVVEVPGPVTTHDPAQASSLPDVLAASLTHRPLLVSSEGQLVPDLLAAVPQGDGTGKTFLLRLRPELRFADGTSLDAAALKGSLVRLLAQTNVAAARVVTAGMAPERLEVLDEQTLQVTLDPPDRAFPYRLALLAASPRSASGFGAGPFFHEPGGGGDAVVGANLWDVEGRPFLDRVVLRAARSRRESRLAALQGELDVRCGVDGLGRGNLPVVTERALVLRAAPELAEREVWLQMLASREGLLSLREALGARVMSGAQFARALPRQAEVHLAVDEDSPVARLVAQRLQLNAHALGRAVVLGAGEAGGVEELSLHEVVAPPLDTSLTAALALPPDEAAALTNAVAKAPEQARALELAAGVGVLLRQPVRCSVPAAATIDEGSSQLTSRHMLVDAVDPLGNLTLERAWWR
ncbi:MAG: ABC transporter substrate-binding protein [Myxococcota bacterium]